MLAAAQAASFDWAPVWSLAQALVIGAVGVIGTLLGTRATDRRAARRAEQERRAARRAEVRKVTVDLVESGVDFATTGLSNIFRVIPLPDGTRYPPSDRKDAADEFTAASQRHVRAISTFLLTVSDADPVAAVTTLRDEMNRMTDVTSPVATKALHDERPSGPELTAVLDYFGNYRDKSNNLLTTLAPFLADPLQQIAD